MKRFFLPIAGCLILFNGRVACGQVLAGIQEIPAPINDMAIASYANGQPVIYYNPVIVRRSDPAVVAFIYAHEYGHHRLGHLSRSLFASNPYSNILLSRQNEMAADDFATDYWLNHDPSILRRVVAFFASPAGNMGDSTHLPTGARAQRIIARVQAVAASNGPSAAATPTARVRAGPQPQGDAKDFSTFAGLKRGANKDDVIALLGQPDDEKTSSTLTHMHYLGDGVTAHCDNHTDKVVSFEVTEAAVNDLANRGIRDSKFRYFGKTSSDIKQIFGEPASEDSDSYTYHLTKTVDVEFRCQVHDRCETIAVDWSN